MGADTQLAPEYMDMQIQFKTLNTDLLGVCSLTGGLLCALATGGFIVAGFTVGGLVGRGGAATCMMYSHICISKLYLNIYRHNQDTR